MLPDSDGYTVNALATSSTVRPCATARVIGKISSDARGATTTPPSTVPAVECANSLTKPSRTPSIFARGFRASGRVCVTTYAGSFVCVDRRTGQEQWTTYLKRDAFRYESFYASPSSDGTRLYSLSRSGTVYALEASGGRVVWRAGVGGLGYTTPAVAEGRVFGGGFDGRLRAWRASSGDELWSTQSGQRIATGAKPSGRYLAAPNRLPGLGMHIEGRAPAKSLHGALAVLDSATGATVQEIGPIPKVLTIIVSPDGTRAAVAGFHGIRFYRVRR